MAAVTKNFPDTLLGETFSYIFTWYDSTETAVRLNGYTAHMQLRVSAPDVAADIASGIPVPDPILDFTIGNGRITLGTDDTDTQGRVSLFCAATDTALLTAGSYKYDLFVTDSGGFRQPLMQGKIKFTGSITVES